ncbi:MAG: hypothetical protein KAJ19_08065 [Gammaproteobacteria bacterium]|nr:hypothetical protein [Gammaproteobacteria bacterium]
MFLKISRHSRYLRFRNLVQIILVLVLLAVFNWAIASWLLWSNYNRLAISLQDSQWPFEEDKVNVAVFREEPGSKQKKLFGHMEVLRGIDWFHLRIEFENKRFEIGAGDTTQLSRPERGVHFIAQPTTFPESRQALAEVAEWMSRLRWWQRVALSVVAHPVITGLTYKKDGLYWRIALRGGNATVAMDQWLDELYVKEPASKYAWRIVLQRQSDTGDSSTVFQASSVLTVKVPVNEIDKSLAAGIRILCLNFQEIKPEPDDFQYEGKGWLVVKNGQRLLYLEGTAYDIGYQHGRLLSSSVKRLSERIVYGVGLYYSMEKAQWFLDEARKLVKRQRPFIAPEYFEEMRGLSDGSGVPLEIIRVANIFPEFFHCSGVAVFGRATKDSKLLHARVLDYMTEVGLQDEAVVMAVNREGALRFVNASYAGFIGSVTGMNEKKIAIGEMGGRGEGLWDGTPMSLLLRGALEHATTLEEAISYMRDRARTCEYYYVISDGNIPDAVGIIARPDTFQVIQSGEAVKILPESIDNAVLMSGGNRYKHLVQRIREHYGQIDAKKLFEIIKRPVAMQSNLHNVIFEPQVLQVWVANAARNEPACDQKPAIYFWPELFPEAKTKK